MIEHKPCGACRALVTPLGCQHWRPEHAVVEDAARAARRARQRITRAAGRERARQSAAAALEQFRKTTTE